MSRTELTVRVAALDNTLFAEVSDPPSGLPEDRRRFQIDRRAAGMLRAWIRALDHDLGFDVSV